MSNNVIFVRERVRTYDYRYCENISPDSDKTFSICKHETPLPIANYQIAHASETNISVRDKSVGYDS